MIVSILIDITLVAFYTLTCIGMGILSKSIIKFAVKHDSENYFDKFIYSFDVYFLLGSSIISLLWLALGLIGTLNEVSIWTILIIVFLSSIYDIFKNIDTGYYRSRLIIKKSSKVVVNKYILLVILSIFVFILAIWYGVLAYLRPPFGDADAFYMTYAKIIGSMGRIEPMPGNYYNFSSVGLSGELHYAAFFVIGDVRAAKLFGWVAGINLIILVASLIRIVGGGALARLLGSLVMLTSTTVTDYLSDGKTDLFAAALATGAAYFALVAAQGARRMESLILSGSLAGLAVVAKLSYIVVLMPSIIFLVYLSIDVRHAFASRDRKVLLTIAKNVFTFSSAMFLFVVPHLLKNYLLFDNPFAPFFGSEENWAEQSWYSAENTLWIIITYPFALVYGLYPLMGGNWSFLWLAALPLVAVAGRGWIDLKRSSTQIALAGCVGLAAWILVKPSVFAPRYVLPSLIMLLPLPMILVERLYYEEVWPKVLAAIYSILVFFAVAVAPFVAPAGVWTAVPKTIISHVKNGMPSCGLAISSYCNGFEWINSVANLGDRIYLAGYYSFQLDPKHLQCLNTSAEASIIEMANISDVWQALYRNGFKMIAVQKATHGHVIEKLDPQKAPKWLQVVVTMENTDMPIYSIESVSPRHIPVLTCQKNSKNRWVPSLYLSKAE